MTTRLDPKADVISEACAWFIEFRSGDAGTGDRARFDEWLRRSPEHIQAYLEVAAGWAELPTSDPDERLHLAELIQRARESQDENVISLWQRTSIRRERRPLRVWARAASVAALALIIGLSSWFGLDRGKTYNTGVGEQRTLRLADGSIIELNALSAIRVRLSKNEREVDLREGQALFHVAKDPRRPFIVLSGDASVRAVGTQFDVYRKDSGTVVTVVEGRVAVAESSPVLPAFDPRAPVSAPLFLVAGEQVTVSTEPSANTELKPKHADVNVATAWVQKRLIFEETPLGEVAEEFNRYNTHKLVISDPELRSMGISGVYSSTDPDSLLGFLRAQPNIQLRETDQGIVVALREKK